MYTTVTRPPRFFSHVHEWIMNFSCELRRWHTACVSHSLVASTTGCVCAGVPFHLLVEQVCFKPTNFSCSNDNRFWSFPAHTTRRVGVYRVHPCKAFAAYLVPARIFSFFAWQLSEKIAGVGPRFRRYAEGSIVYCRKSEVLFSKTRYCRKSEVLSS